MLLQVQHCIASPQGIALSCYSTGKSLDLHQQIEKHLERELNRACPVQKKTCGQHNKWHYNSLMRIFEKTKTNTKTLGEHLQRTTFETCTVKIHVTFVLFLPNQKLRILKPYNQHSTHQHTGQHLQFLQCRIICLGKPQKKRFYLGQMTQTCEPTHPIDLGLGTPSIS